MTCCGTSEGNVDIEKPRNPLAARKNVCCTDIIFLLLFIAFWCLMIYIAVYSILRGDIKRLTHGYDSFGNTCNHPGNIPLENVTYSGQNTEGKGYVLFMGTIDPFHSMQICVSKCPNKTLNTLADVVQYMAETGNNICRYDIKIGELRSEMFSSKGPCPSLPIYKSYPLLSRCVPNPVSLIDKTSLWNTTQKFVQVFDLDTALQKTIADVCICWKEMIALCALALVIGFMMVIIMRLVAFIMVWLIVILAAVGSIVGTVFLWWTYAKKRSENNSESKLYIPVLDVDVKNETAFLVFSIVATVLTVTLLLLIIVMIKRISLVIAIFKEAGRCLVDMPLLLIQPLFTFIILFVFFVYWTFILGCISTTGKPVIDTSGFVHVKYVEEGVAKYFAYIHAVGLIWTSEFILASQQFIIANSVANWYFSVEKGCNMHVVVTSFCNLIVHHLGSVALGSMIISAVKIPRYILMYIHSKCEGSQNECAKCCLKCCICCLWCLEKFLKFINQNAYTIIAIEGDNFCTSAKKAFSILTSNVLRVAAINSVGDFVLFLGKIGVMAATTATAIVWFKSLPQLHYYAVPVLIISIFSFLIGHCFLSVYEMVVDATLLCFCEDCQLNDGSEGHEYYMSDSLKEFVEKSSIKIDNLRSSKKSPPAKEMQNLNA